MNQKLMDDITRIAGVNPRKCMKCGKCSASCPSFNEMDIKPHQFVSYVLNDDIESLVNSKSLWKCLSCFACVERCPRNVEPAKLIEAVRLAVIRQQGENHLPAEKPSAPVYEGDVFTVRGKGRFALTALPGKSKKERLIIEFFQY